MKKRIGISFCRGKGVFENYWNWLKDGLPEDVELVELSFEKKNTSAIYFCDGFVLTGGVDIEPAVYGESSDYANGPSEGFQPQRDNFETWIFRYAQSNSLPLLAICRGMQLVNVLQGGKLFRDLDQHACKGLNEIHRKLPKAQDDKEHGVRIQANSLLHEITGLETGQVNSAHHQAAKENALGENLVANAYANDEFTLIEGLEFKDKTNKPFLLGVQWHPERMKDRNDNPLSKKIRERFIEEVRKQERKKMNIINPATEEIITDIPEDSRETVEQKFKSAKQAQPAWADTPLAQRIACIAKFRELLEEEKEELAKTLTAEVGKPLQQSYNELNGAHTRIQFFLDHSEKHLADEWIIQEGVTKEKIVYEPLGVIANISAWNYPYLVGVNVFIPALIGGNSVLYKPSEYAILTGLHIQRLLLKSGIPAHCFQVVIGKGNVGEYLLELPLNGYFFTGSYKTGKYIAERVASKLVPCQLELGGKDPLYVMDDVEDIENTAAAALEGVVYNNGQSCCAVERIYVHEKVYDRFVQSYVEQAKKMKIGDPMDTTTEIGPLSRKEQLNFLSDQIKEAVSKGATLLFGGNSLQQKGYFIEPAVLVNVNHDMKLMTEESFGPVVGIQKVKDDEEAAQLMQDTEYGLTAAVYSKNYERAEKIMKKMHTGTVYWNCCDRVSAGLPWSGRKNSGLGSTLSYHGIRAFVQPKAYHIRG